MGKSKKEKLEKIYEEAGLTPRTSKDAWEEGEKVDTTLFRKLPIDAIEVDPQVRTTMDEEKIQELMESIKTVGLIHPIEVVPKKEIGKYKLITGHRRLEAAKRLGWEKIPVLVRFEVSDDDRPFRQLVENLQREDLDPIDEALAYARLNEAGYSHVQIAEIIGKSRTRVTHTLRITSLILKMCDVAHVSSLSEIPPKKISLAKKELSGMAKDVLIELASLIDSPLFEKALKMAKAGATVKQLRALKAQQEGSTEKATHSQTFLSVPITGGTVKLPAPAMDTVDFRAVEQVLLEMKQKLEKILPQGLFLETAKLVIKKEKEK